MASWQEFRLHSVQPALFTAHHASFSTSRTVGAILRRYGEEFSGEMQTLPIPAEMPPEIPRVTLQSADGRKRLNIGPARFDYVWTHDPDVAPTSLAEAIHECEDLLVHYIEEMHVRVGRLGLIVERVCRHENPAQAIIRRFCTPEAQREPFNRSTTFEIHNHKEYTPRYDGVDYQINSWVRCRSAKVKPDDQASIVVVQDINTMAGELDERRFDAEGVRTVF